MDVPNAGNASIPAIADNMAPQATSSATQPNTVQRDWEAINDQSDFYARLRNFK